MVIQIIAVVAAKVCSVKKPGLADENKGSRVRSARTFCLDPPKQDQ